MEIKELLALYARHPQVRALARVLKNEKVRTLQVTGLQASAAPLALSAAVGGAAAEATCLFVLADAEDDFASITRREVDEATGRFTLSGTAKAGGLLYMRGFVGKEVANIVSISAPGTQELLYAVYVCGS